VSFYNHNYFLLRRF